MTEESRKYKGKDIDFLITAETILQSAIELQAPLIIARPQWTDPYFPNIITEIQGLYGSVLGIDNAKEMREATIALYNLIAPASDALLMFKTQLSLDFATNTQRQKEILTQLGYTQHYKSVRSKDQEGIIELLTKFKTNLTPTLLTELTDAGINPIVISKVTSFTDIFKNANITQEVAKGGRKTITAEGISQLNQLYAKIIAISKIGALVFKKDKASKDRLNYNKTIKKLNFHSSKTQPQEPAP